MKDEQLEHFENAILEMNQVINRNKLKQKQEEYYKDCDRWSSSQFLWTNNKILKSLARRGLIPSAISAKRKMNLFGILTCESHYDKIKYYLSN